MSTTSTTVMHVTDANFESEVVGVKGITVAKFSAEWCAPCHILTPVFDAVASARGEQARFVDVDGDASPAASVRFGVRGLPTVLFFRDGEVVGRVVGAVPRERLEQELNRLIAS